MADIARLGFSVDTSGLVRAERAIDSLSRAARGLRDISLRVDVSGAAEAMRQLDRLDGRNISARVTVDVSGADAATRELDQLSANRTTRIDVTVAGIDALRSIDNLVNNRSIRIDANVTGISEALRDLDRLAVNRTVRIDANVTGISEALRDLDRLAVNRSIRIDANVTGISEALRDLDRLAVNRTVRIDASTTGISEALRDIDRIAVNRSIRIDATVTGISEALRDINRLSGGARGVRIDVGINGVEAALRGLRDIERLAVNRTVRIDIDTGDIGRAISDLERLAQQARDAAAEINGLGANVNVTSGALGGLGGMAAGVIAGVIGVAVVIADATTDLIKHNAELNLLTGYLGVSREAMQVWGTAGKAMGVEIADVFKDVQEKIGEFAATGGGEAADVFKKLKLDVNDLIALSPDQQLLKIADAMSKITDMSMGEKSFLLESLGNDATRLLPLLENNAAKLRELDEIMRNSGSIITDEQNAALQEAYSNMTLLQAASEGATNALGMVGAEILNAFADDAVSAISGIGETVYILTDEFYAAADAWTNTAGLMSDDAGAAADAIAGAFDWLLSGLASGANQMVELFRIGFTYLPNFAIAAFQAMIDYSMSWIHAAAAGFDAVKAAAGGAFASVVDFAGKAFGSVASIAGQVVGYVIGRLADMAAAVGGALSGMAVVPGMEGLSANVAGVEARLRGMAGAANSAGAAVTSNFSAMAGSIRAAANESSASAKISSMMAANSKISAKHALANASAMMIESEGNRARTIEMGKAERQFARLGSSLGGAGAAGKKFRVDQDAVNKAMDDGAGKAGKAAKAMGDGAGAAGKAAKATKGKSDADKEAAKAARELEQAQKKIADAYDREYERLEGQIIKYRDGEDALYKYKLTKDNLTDGMQATLIGMKAEAEALEEQHKAREKATKAYEKAIESLDDENAKLTLNATAYREYQLGVEGVTGAKAAEIIAREQAMEKAGEEQKLFEGINKKLEEALVQTITSGKADWGGLIEYMIQEATRLLVIKPLLESLTSSLSGGGGAGGIGGAIGSLLGFTNGGAFSGGVQQYATGGAFHNSVLSRPTQFFANGGLAVAGEAGAEAVMPLTRINGRLGVQSTGANVTVQPQIKINIVNNAGAKVETQQQTDNDGNINMTVMINQIEGAISDRARRGQGLANVFKRVG